LVGLLGLGRRSTVARDAGGRQRSKVVICVLVVEAACLGARGGGALLSKERMSKQTEKQAE
jgi:hypothetical protein